MIIALIYIFLSYVMFDQHLKITLRKSSVPSEKVRLPDIESAHSHLSHPSPLLHKTYPFQLLIYLPMDNSKILPPKLHS